MRIQRAVRVLAGAEVARLSPHENLAGALAPVAQSARCKSARRGRQVAGIQEKSNNEIFGPDDFEGEIVIASDGVPDERDTSCSHSRLLTYKHESSAECTFRKRRACDRFQRSGIFTTSISTVPRLASLAATLVRSPLPRSRCTGMKEHKGVKC
jgi:hypothetical protein